MSELQHFDDRLDLLIEWDSKRHYGCLRGVVYDRAEAAQDATRLAVNLNVPLMTARDLPDRPKTATQHLRSGPGTHALRRSRPALTPAPVLPRSSPAVPNTRSRVKINHQLRAAGPVTHAQLPP